MRELARYFALLSADFRVAKALRLLDYHPEWFKSIPDKTWMAIERALPFLRPNLHLEIELADKRHGVIADPGW